METLLGIVRQLEGDLGGTAGAWHQEQQQQEQPTVPRAHGGCPALHGASRGGGLNQAAETRGQVYTDSLRAAGLAWGGTTKMHR